MKTVRKVIVVLGFVALFMVSVEFMVRQRMDLIEVVVVNKTCQQRYKLEEQDLTTLKTSRHLVPEDALVSKEALVGQYVKMEHTLLKNQIVRQDNVEILDEAIDAPQLLLYEDQRVYALKKDVVGTAGASLQRGSYVDVALQLKKEGEYGVIIENVRVVGVRDRQGTDLKEGGIPHVILLAINSQDINTLLKAEEEGKVVLLPRNLNHGV